jgi:acyl-homoserine lactone acylase PvdQ
VRTIRTIIAAMALLALAPATALAAPSPGAFRANDVGGFRDVLPPGTNGLANATGLGSFLTLGTRPTHNDDQRDMYGNLVFGAPNIQTSQLPEYYKDGSFGVSPGQIDDSRTVTFPGVRDDVTIVRDKQFGVPHIYATTRAGGEFGLGYAAAQDRLFFIDILRHLGRAQLSSFAGGAPGNRDFDRSQWAIAPYTEADLQRQFDLGPVIYGAEGAQLQQDAINYVAGINQYINEAKADLTLTKMPAEYQAINKPLGPDPWKVTDIIATASLVGGIFGKGGGGELTWGKLLQDFQAKLGPVRGKQAWLQLRAVDDAEAPTTVHNGQRFPYRTVPKRPASGSVALPDPGSLTTVNEAHSIGSASSQTSSRRAGVGGGARRGLLAFPRSASNALLVSAGKSESGHALAVMGPQVAYFAPEILMEQDVHAPTLEAKGASFPGVNLFVELGRGRDYSWSATSAGQDIVDTFAVDLCNPSGGAVSKDSDFYMFRGQCLKMEQLDRTNSWSPNLADSTPAGSETLSVQRTKMGLVTARATIGGKPVAYTQLRSTYFHEVDSALGFSDFNNPDKMNGPSDFQHAAAKIGYTFNWFYNDDKHIAYFNSGNNPVRAPNTDPTLPVRAKFEWQNFNPDINTAAYTPFNEHPQTIDQDYLTSWNNKQAPGYNAPDTDATYTSIYRSQSLDDRIQGTLARKGKMNLTDLVNAMGDAGTVDLRGSKVLPWALKVLGKPSDPELAAAVAKLTAWEQGGAHRRDLSPRDGKYDDSDAVAIMDAWWPRLVTAEFGPLLGTSLLNELESADPIDNPPNNSGDHLGSAYDVGFYGSVQEDLRAVLNPRRRSRTRHHKLAVKRKARRATAASAQAQAAKARKRHHRQRHKRLAAQSGRVVFCGGGRLATCRAALQSSLRDALHVSRTTLYHDPGGKCPDGDQTCFDSISFRALGGITQPLIPWINRPTYQQANEIQGHR